MNRNQLKLLACFSMLIDHIGYFLLPDFLVFTVCGIEFPLLRCFGRLAFPLFAFFIGEGAHYTHNRKKYLLLVTGLGLGCQLVYIAEELISTRRLTMNSSCWYFNILLTFALAIGMCYLLDNALKKRKPSSWVIFSAAAILIAGIMTVFEYLNAKETSSLYFDYGISGILIPVCVSAFPEKNKKTAAFAVTTFLYCILFTVKLPYVWCSLLAIPLIIIYNNKPGSKKFKYFFYIFYPSHLAALYLINEIIN